MMQVVFPAPTAAAGWTLWGFSFNQWRDAQFVALCVCALLAIEHLVLHWNWVCTVIANQVLRVKKRPDEGVQVVYGVGTMIAISPSCWPASSPRSSPSNTRPGDAGGNS